MAASVFRRSRVGLASRSTPRYQEYVIRLKRLEDAAKLCAIGLGSAHVHGAVHLEATSLGKLMGLHVNALALAGR
jgi:succinyl-CoA synthetase alpha subunit